MTEDEAKTKMCPLLRSPAVAVAIDMVDASVDEKAQAIKAISCCKGSECMMWVWLLTPNQAAQMNLQSNAKAKASGHCGLIKNYKQLDDI